MLFEIAATENPGVFEVSAKFMGVSMDKVELVFQVRTGVTGRGHCNAMVAGFPYKDRCHK